MKAAVAEKTGTFYGVGVGPGDPELMTVKSMRVIESCPVIAVPLSSAEGSSDSQGRAVSIVRQAVSLEGKEIIELYLPMTRDKAVLARSRKEAASKIAERLKDGKDVAFITLGDPMLYSTFSYLLPFIKGCAEGSRIVSVPGITSFSAASSRILCPLAEAGEKVAIVPAAYDTEELRGLIESFDAVVLMKVHKAMDSLIELLSDMGLDEKAVFVARLGWPGEEVVEGIKGLKGGAHDYFSMLIVRK